MSCLVLLIAQSQYRCVMSRLKFLQKFWGFSGQQYLWQEVLSQSPENGKSHPVLYRDSGKKASTTDPIYVTYEVSDFRQGLLRIKLHPKLNPNMACSQRKLGTTVQELKFFYFDDSTCVIKYEILEKLVTSILQSILHFGRSFNVSLQAKKKHLSNSTFSY